LKNAGKQKIVHGKFVNRIGVAFLDEQRNLQWLDQGFFVLPKLGFEKLDGTLSRFFMRILVVPATSLNIVMKHYTVNLVIVKW